MYIVKKTTRYQGGKSNISYFKELYLGMMCFSNRENAREFKTKAEANKIAKMLIVEGKSTIEVEKV